ncbi:MAG: hypothetical protein ACTSQA_01495 [Candidatus Heimdallarchaeaceae archaeon]
MVSKKEFELFFRAKKEKAGLKIIRVTKTKTEARRIAKGKKDIIISQGPVIIRGKTVPGFAVQKVIFKKKIKKRRFPRGIDLGSFAPNI